MGRGPKHLSPEKGANTKEMVMGEQERFVEQQFIASEAAVALDKMVAGLGELEQIGLHAYVATHSDLIQASMMLAREVILKYYGLTDDPMTEADMDDFVEYVVDEVNR
jgi:hypothetical protein